MAYRTSRVSRELVLIALMLITGSALAGDWRGDLGLEYRWFAKDPLFPEQHNAYASVAFEPEWYHENDEGSFAFTFVPFARIDQYDDERTHYDLRELNFLWVRDSWELRAGLGKVFWGVTESRHLVDIINQTDLVEQPDGEAKLGQPMVNLTLIGNWGTLDLFVLPGFRERTFPGVEGRLRSDLVVDTDNPLFESDKEDEHVDVAIRWANYFGLWDVGVSHFRGTSRDPILIPWPGSEGAPPVLRPYYPQIDQTGLEVQATVNSWLFKLEAIRRSGFGETFVATSAGFEYTFYGLFGSVADLGVLAEHNYDDRRGVMIPFNNDLFTGLRVTMNDTQSTALLVGCFIDLDETGRLCRIEGSRRLTDNWFAELEVRVFSRLGETSIFHAFRNDDFIGLTLEYNF